MQYNKNLKKKRKENQQVTIKTDTSETICVNTLNTTINNSFLNWFIGYLEGSELIWITKVHNIRFELNTHYNNKKIFYYIKKNLGYGFIKLEIFLNTKIWVFIIDNKEDLLNLTNKLNGNWVFRDKLEKFKIWWELLYLKLKIMKKENLLNPLIFCTKQLNLENSCLLGYLENRAIFVSKLRKINKKINNYKLNLSIIIWSIQPENLLKIINLLKLNKEIKYKHKNLEIFKINLENDFNFEILINYFKIYKFKTIQKFHYNNWFFLLQYKKKKKNNKLNYFLIKKFLCTNNYSISNY